MFKKIHLHIGGRDVPAVIKPDEIWTAEVTLAARNGRPERKVMNRFAEAISLRETNPDGDDPGRTYYRKTPENLGFTTDRDDYVLGLDVTEDGELISESMLNKLVAASINERQTTTLAQRVAQVVSLDDEDETLPEGVTA